MRWWGQDEVVQVEGVRVEENEDITCYCIFVGNNFVFIIGGKQSFYVYITLKNHNKEKNIFEIFSWSRSSHQHQGCQRRQVFDPFCSIVWTGKN